MVDISKIAKNAGGAAGQDLGKKAQSGIGSAAMGALGARAGGVVSRAVNSFSSAFLNTEYPNVAFRFAVEIDGIVAAQFSEMSGAEWEMAEESFHEGGMNFHERHLVSAAKFTALTLKRGFTPAGSEFFLWMKSHFEDKKYKRRNLSVIVQNQEGVEVGRFNFRNAFITKYGAPGLNADNNSVAFESVTLRYDYFEYQPRDAKEVIAEQVASLALSTMTGGIPGR